MLCSITKNLERLMRNLDPRKEILDHTDRPAGGCQESQKMLERVNQACLTQERQWWTWWKKIGFNSNTLRHRTVRYTSTRWPHKSARLKNISRLKKTHTNKTSKSPHYRESCYFLLIELYILEKEGGERCAQGKRIIMAAKVEQTGKTMLRLNT